MRGKPPTTIWTSVVKKTFSDRQTAECRWLEGVALNIAARKPIAGGGEANAGHETGVRGEVPAKPDQGGEQQSVQGFGPEKGCSIVRLFQGGFSLELGKPRICNLRGEHTKKREREFERK